MVWSQSPYADPPGGKGSSRAGCNPLRVHFTQAIAHAASIGGAGHVSRIGNPSHDLDRPLFSRL